MRKKPWVSLVIFLCLLGLAACGLSSDGSRGTITEVGSVTEKEPESNKPDIEQNDPAPAAEPDLSQREDPKVLELKNNFLTDLRQWACWDLVDDAVVEMGNPIHMEISLREAVPNFYWLSLLNEFCLAHRNWLAVKGSGEFPTWDQYQEITLDLTVVLSGDTYQYRYHYHDNIWDAVFWPEGQTPFFFSDETLDWDGTSKEPDWDPTPKERGDFIEGDEIFNADDFYAIYRELGLESDGRVANESRVIERLGQPERFFARLDGNIMYPFTHLYFVYPFGEVYFQDTTLVRLTNDSIPGPRGTRVGDHYEDVIAKFPREENREDYYLYQVAVYVTDGPMSPNYRISGEGVIGHDWESGDVTIVRYRNGWGNVEYEIENDLVVSISTYMFIDGW
jgi:hypothetical protein